jgi:hypothetical protein
MGESQKVKEGNARQLEAFAGLRFVEGWPCRFSEGFDAVAWKVLAATLAEDRAMY